MVLVNDNLVRSIVPKIVQAIKPERIILFGSRATANHRPDSDIDLLIIYDGPLSKREVKLKVWKLFPLPTFSMDLFVLSTEEFEKRRDVANTLAREVSEKGVVCYAG